MKFHTSKDIGQRLAQADRILQLLVALLTCGVQLQTVAVSGDANANTPWALAQGGEIGLTQSLPWLGKACMQARRDLHAVRHEYAVVEAALLSTTCDPASVQGVWCQACSHICAPGPCAAISTVFGTDSTNQTPEYVTLAAVHSRRC